MLKVSDYYVKYGKKRQAAEFGYKTKQKIPSAAQEFTQRVTTKNTKISPMTICKANPSQ